jgi:hypothetical protein
MSEAKHTPGPWHVMDSKGAFGPSVGLVIVSEQIDDAIIASVGEDVPGHVANANVLAAAPDLLAELRNIAAADPSKWDEEVRHQFREWAQSRARAAIAKAEAPRA